MKCRFCDSNASRSFVNLGHQPPSNAYLTETHLGGPEITYPLTAYVCEECWLVQLPAHAHADELFTESYAYFSSVSSSWVEHARLYVEEMIPRLNLSSESLVVEIASNDGYLLQFFQAAGITCTGIEPTASTAAAAREKGIESIEEFFGVSFARQFKDNRRKADLVLGNNVLAHVPDLNDFLSGTALILEDDGVVTFEFPHLLNLVEGVQFDTIYHEHYSYLSFSTVARMFEAHGLRMFDVKELPTHGGSLRVFGTPAVGTRHQTLPSVAALLQRENDEGMSTADWYDGFQPRVDRIKHDLLRFLLECKQNGRSVAGYGAAAKGNTLLNYAGVKSDLLPFVCDAAPSKQGRFLPGSHIPIHPPSALKEAALDCVLILPWNIRDEIATVISELTDEMPALVTAVPTLKEFQVA